MKQRYRELTHELCVQAVLACFNKKWKRRDVVTEISKYLGCTRKGFLESIAGGNLEGKLAAAEALAYEMENRLERLFAGDENALDLDAIICTMRKDGVNGKVRPISYCCIFHQLFNHLLFLGLEPLFKAKILPQQYASIPGKGQTALADDLYSLLHKSGLNINYARKTDIKKAYPTLKYTTVINLIRKEIPSASWIITTLEALAKMSADGSLIIGGYLDAWLFNYTMSYALRYVLGLSKTRRDKTTCFLKRAPSFMDDFGLLASREADLNMAIKKLAKFLSDNYGLTLKLGKATHFLSIEEEKRRNKAESPAARGCPSIDMGGYVVHRTYVTIRKPIYKRLRYRYLRAASELGTQGYISVKRARQLTSGWGYLKHTNSYKAKQKLKAAKLFRIAKKTISNHDRRQNNGKKH